MGVRMGWFKGYGLKLRLNFTLFALGQGLNQFAKRNAGFRSHMQKQNCTVQISLRDGSLGRTFTFSNGKVRSTSKLPLGADVTMVFKDVATAVTLMTPPVNYAENIHARQRTSS